jgi:hypothetical protein
MNMTIEEFCDKHDACVDIKEWAVATGARDMAALWARTDMQPEWRLWIATRPGLLDDRTLRLFACWSVRQVWHLLTDKRSRNAVEIAERYANGKATAEELEAARAAAWAAAWAAAGEAAGEAAWAAGAAARAAAREAAGKAAWAAARAAEEAGRAAAGAAQTQWLRQNTQPNFVARKENV